MNPSWVKREAAMLQSLAQKHDVPLEAVQALAVELARTRGRAVRFDIAALGGEGRWKYGERANVGNGFNEDLNRKVTAICMVIAEALQDREDTLLFDRTEAPSPSVKPADQPQRWWPDGFGDPTADGLISGMRYAYFPERDRLLMQHNLRTRYFDTTGYVVDAVIQTEIRGFPGILVQTNQGPLMLHTLPETLS